jgi:hypothetical protein
VESGSLNPVIIGQDGFQVYSASCQFLISGLLISLSAIDFTDDPDEIKKKHLIGQAII